MSFAEPDAGKPFVLRLFLARDRAKLSEYCVFSFDSDFKNDFNSRSHALAWERTALEAPPQMSRQSLQSIGFPDGSLGTSS